MSRDRNKQKQIWSDKEFADRLERIKAKRLLLGFPVKTLGQLTKEMLQCPSFDNLEKELIERIHMKSNIKIKLDKKDLFKIR